MTSLLILVGIGLDIYVQYTEYIEDKRIKILQTEKNSNNEE